jgi:(p)ppGpp synthase/HD superfamily hydrolase
MSRFGLVSTTGVIDPYFAVGLRFMREAHRGQKRLSGEPFCVHPCAVASILRGWGLCVTTQIAGLAHDVLEDCTVSPENLTCELGRDVSKIVEAVTKFDLPSASRQESELVFHSRLLSSALLDSRPLFVRLADRLHNVQQIRYLKPERQKTFALETLTILLPEYFNLGFLREANEVQARCLAVLPAETVEFFLAYKSDPAALLDFYLSHP